MSSLEASEASSPSNDSVPYLFKTNLVEDGEVITLGVRENPVTIGDTEEPELIDHGSCKAYEDILVTNTGTQDNPDENT